MLFVVRAALLFACCCLWFGVRCRCCRCCFVCCCLLFVDACSLLPGWCVLCVVCCMMFAVACLLSVGYYLLLATLFLLHC